MRAININVSEFLDVLTRLKDNNVNMIDLDMVQDENHPKMNKLVIHPIKQEDDENFNKAFKDLPEKNNLLNNKIEIRDPNFNIENNEIFDSFEDIL